MKAKIFTLILACSLPFVVACAGKKVKKVEQAPAAAPVVEEKEEAPVITQECLVNISLFTESAKNKQYADALEPWYAAYNECPNASLAIYQRGDDILKWQYGQATTAEEKDKVRNTLMQMYDKRIKYFGDNAKYPKAYVLGDKALAYIAYFPEDELKETAYNWLLESVEGMGAKSKVSVVQQFARLSVGLYKADANRQPQYISDYQKASDVLAAIINDPATKEATRNNAQLVKEEIDNTFAASILLLSNNVYFFKGLLPSIIACSSKSGVSNILI